jgi:NAD(P)-dependent dehydrogenase (short-subunit alcohol dehydrogenase family)
MHFKGKSVVVTAGAGGIGRAVVGLFARGWAKAMVSDLVRKGCKYENRVYRNGRHHDGDG